ncbi:DUF192 domain-containing protein [Bdellovibrio bacteriovorus]|uniref:DUF192 domain-containing protein n=1 Tax=Bdellovibrio bacteriovorus TaxID=959 RepID=UPI0009BE66DD|nr:DUF192 domain-containing protein [Bdellovibrio bacteriovorus]
MASRLRCFVNKSLALLLVAFVFLTGSYSFAASEFQKKKITLGTKTLVVEIAETPAQHERGLMFRNKLGENDGMLFIFDGEQTRFFWMKNTFIDLSIGYFDGSGSLIDIQEMKSGKGIPDAALASYPSSKPAKYALEMNKGWFSKNKIKLGTKLKIK